VCFATASDHDMGGSCMANTIVSGEMADFILCVTLVTGGEAQRRLAVLLDGSNSQERDVLCGYRAAQL
jgi:hypothetical protein